MPSIKNSSVWYKERGITYYSKGDVDQAIEDYNKAIDLDPEFAVTNKFQLFKLGNGNFESMFNPFEASTAGAWMPSKGFGETITGGIILGRRLAARLGIIKGDVLRLLVKLEPIVREKERAFEEKFYQVKASCSDTSFR